MDDRQNVEAAVLCFISLGTIDRGSYQGVLLRERPNGLASR